jgi:hypothetical protein
MERGHIGPCDSLWGKHDVPVLRLNLLRKLPLVVSHR